MSIDLKTAGPKDEITVLKEIFDKFRIHHVPIVDENKVVGVVSKSDFLYLLRGFTDNEMDHYREMAKLRAFKVREIMYQPVETIRQSEPVKKAVAVLAENRFQCLPVVNDEDELVGIVTTHDIIDMVNEMGG
jgi:acetoin utilization protein AcuB